MAKMSKSQLEVMERLAGGETITGFKRATGGWMYQWPTGGRAAAAGTILSLEDRGLVDRVVLCSRLVSIRAAASDLAAVGE